LAIKQGPYGEYTGCLNCKYIKRETTGVACIREGCGGEICVKKSRRGKVFYGCGNYPKCDAVFWDKPVEKACPQCQKPFTLEKYNAKKDETMHYCSDEACGYRSDGSVARPKSGTAKTAAKAPAAKAPAKKAATKKASAKAKTTTADVVAAEEVAAKPVARLRKAAKPTE
jgi:hypothetical protein